MNIKILKNFLFKKHVKLPYSTVNNTKCSSTNPKRFPKKKYTIKNKFRFQNEFQQNIIHEVDSKHRIVSSNSLAKSDECEEKFDGSYFPSQGFVSGKLISEKRKLNQQNNKLSQKERSHRVPLTYKGEILFGVHPVYLALQERKRIFHHLYTREDMESSEADNSSRKCEIIKLAKSLAIPVSFLDSRGLKILASEAVHQGVCLDAGFLPITSWNENHSELDASESRPLWLVLDEILDPMNVGAIIRSAHYFGVKTIFTVRGHSCKLSPTVSKASSGSLEVLNLFQIENLAEFIKNRKKKGWCIVSTLAYSENKSEVGPVVSAAEFSSEKPTVLVLGNEGRGISQEVLKLCDTLISIEPGQALTNGIDSLNVSVAAGVILYALNNSNNHENLHHKYL